MSTVEALPYVCTLQRNTEILMSCSYLLPLVYISCQTPHIVTIKKRLKHLRVQVTGMKAWSHQNQCENFLWILQLGSCIKNVVAIRKDCVPSTTLQFFLYYISTQCLMQLNLMLTWIKLSYQIKKYNLGPILGFTTNCSLFILCSLERRKLLVTMICLHIE